MARRLTATDVRATFDPTSFTFRTTVELPPLEGLIGQDRALVATAFGMGMRQPGFNLFVCGPPATGKTRAMHDLLARAAAAEPSPSDWCYVHDFADPYRPIALELPAGQGRVLREQMAALVEECRERLPRAFEGEEFERRKATILETLAQRQQAAMHGLEHAAAEEGFAIVRTPGGFGVAPAEHGEPLTPEAFAALPESRRRELEAHGKTLEERVEATLREMRTYEREARQAHDELVRTVATSVTRQLVQELRERFPDQPAVARYLDEVEEDLITHAADFRALAEGRPTMPFLPQPGAFLDHYRVNVLVERAGNGGAPVVVEENPTFGRLVGRIEHRFHFGALVTDITLVKAGALHRANGGYLILDARDVLRSFLSWDALKKALKSRSVRIEEPLEELRVVGAATLAPAPIPLAVKVVLIGSPELYYLLHALDEDFRDLFKVKVDFDDSLPRTPETAELYARFVGAMCREEGLLPFSPAGVGRLLEHGSRLVAHQERLTARLGQLLDLVREAAFWAGREGRSVVEAVDVGRAIAEKRRRENLVEERLGRMIDEGTLVIATGGTAVGQVNGIAVIALGDHAFGRPSRITARTFAGEPGVVDIEREAKLGGRLHSKGVLILTGFLAGRYARTQPLALSASIAFEQHYEEIDGDSASSAELYALLSSLAGIPLTQSLAVTGSVNQAGEIQAVGGINEKIEGFFDVCRARGLGGEQGVIIPTANVRHLMLREDVVDAIRAGRFQVHAVATVDEGLALLSGREAGVAGPDGRFPEGTFNGTVERALAENVVRRRTLRDKEKA